MLRYLQQNIPENSTSGRVNIGCGGQLAESIARTAVDIKTRQC
jgi:hypothetical protein